MSNFEDTTGLTYYQYSENSGQKVQPNMDLEFTPHHNELG